VKEFFDVAGLRRKQMAILRILHNYCQEHGITYCLAYGTLIGAIRHKGYIPWDDDIDVLMPRKDYDRFVREFNKGRIDAYKVLYHEADPGYYLPFAKVVNTETVLQEEVNSDYKIGIYVDIFPLDSLSDDYETAKKIMRKGFRYHKLLLMKNLKIRKDRAWYKNLILRTGRAALSLVSRDHLLRKIESYCRRRSSDQFTKYVGDMAGISSGDEKRVFEAKWFEEFVLAPFEGEEFYIPAGYDSFLRKLYGDYMEFPPVEQRASHHVFKAWREV